MPIAPKTFSQRVREKQGKPDRRLDDRAYDRKRKADPTLAASKTLRDSVRWQKFRRWFKAQHPLCCDPFDSHGLIGKPTAQVHHIEGLATRPDLALSEDNCVALCTKCHARIEAMERRGEVTAGLFRHRGAV